MVSNSVLIVPIIDILKLLDQKSERKNISNWQNGITFWNGVQNFHYFAEKLTSPIKKPTIVVGECYSHILLLVPSMSLRKKMGDQIPKQISKFCSQDLGGQGKSSASRKGLKVLFLLRKIDCNP